MNKARMGEAGAFPPSPLRLCHPLSTLFCSPTQKLSESWNSTRSFCFAELHVQPPLPSPAQWTGLKVALSGDLSHPKVIQGSYLKSPHQHKLRQDSKEILNKRHSHHSGNSKSFRGTGDKTQIFIIPHTHLSFSFPFIKILNFYETATENKLPLQCTSLLSWPALCPPQVKPKDSTGSWPAVVSHGQGNE